jgi:hypothetical protein
MTDNMVSTGIARSQQESRKLIDSLKSQSDRTSDGERKFEGKGEGEGEGEGEGDGVGVDGDDDDGVDGEADNCGGSWIDSVCVMGRMRSLSSSLNQ